MLIRNTVWLKCIELGLCDWCTPLANLANMPNCLQHEIALTRLELIIAFTATTLLGAAVHLGLWGLLLPGVHCIWALQNPEVSSVHQLRVVSTAIS